MLRLPSTGSSDIRVASKRTPTSALVTFKSGASARTSVTSVRAAGLISASTTAVWLTDSVTPDRTYREKPVSSTVTS